MNRKIGTVPNFAALAIVCASIAASAAPFSGPYVIEGASIHGDRIAFGSGGKVWLANIAGGAAETISTTTAYDSMPVFSPDGATIAFLRRTERVYDIYLHDTATGDERRLTYHPARDFPIGWTPDGGSVLLVSNREGSDRLFTMAEDTPLPSALPLPKGYAGSFSPDATRIAYLPRARDYQFTEYRYYRGGESSPLWIAELSTSAITRVTEGKDNARDPMWIGDRVYFLWDRDGRFDLNVYDVNTKEIRTLAALGDFETRNAATDGRSIILVGAGGLQRFDIESETVSPITIALPLDDSALRARIENGANEVQSHSVNSDGSRAVVCARGDVFFVDTKTGTAANITKTTGVAEREAHLSSDGQQLAYFSDASGEYALHVRNVAFGAIQTIVIETEPTFYSELTWSPGGKFIAFSDKRLAIWIADVAAGTAKVIDQSTSSAQGLFQLDWSPDGHYLAYSKHGENRLPRIFIHDLAAATSMPVTPGDCYAIGPVFDRTGRYLYFISSPNAPMSDFGWSVLAGKLHEPLVVMRVNAIVLGAGDPAPVLSGGPNLAVNWKLARTAPIDFDGIESRIVPIDVAPRTPAAIAAITPGVLHLTMLEWPGTPGAITAVPTKDLYRLDLRAPSELKKTMPLVTSMAVAGDGNTVVTREATGWRTGTFTGAKVDIQPLTIGALPAPVDPALEWKQIHREASRLMRDLFYDPNHHGLDWEAVEQRYAAYLPGIRSREQLNVLMRRMYGHVSVSHLGVGGGAIVPSLNENERVGMLGADLDIADGLYRFAHVLKSGHFDLADPAVSAPLAQPGAEVADGEYLLAIDDEAIDGSHNLFERMRGKAGMQVRLIVGPTTGKAQAREIRVVPLTSETALRVANWSARNADRVRELSGGTLGYFHIPAYSAAGVQSFLRGYFAGRTKPGMIIDQRFNGGGVTADYFVELLRREPLFRYTFRDGDDLPVPVNGRTNPATVVLINEENASAAETFPMMFQLAKIGPLVGARTGGGVIGPYSPRPTPGLIDGGGVRIPTRAAFIPGGTWPENDGIHPDIEVEVLPEDWRAGRDPQLEVAVKAALDLAAQRRSEELQRPPYPEHP